MNIVLYYFLNLLVWIESDGKLYNLKSTETYSSSSRKNDDGTETTKLGRFFNTTLELVVATKPTKNEKTNQLKRRKKIYKVNIIRDPIELPQPYMEIISAHVRQGKKEKYLEIPPMRR